MKLTDLDNVIVQALAESEHPEISEIEVVPTVDLPNNHARVVVRFVSFLTQRLREVDNRASRASIPTT